MSLGLLLKLCCLLVFVNVASTADMFSYGGISFTYFSTPMDWPQAKRHCVSKGLHLAIPGDDIAAGLRKHIVDQYFEGGSLIWVSGGGDGMSAVRWTDPGGDVTTSGPAVLVDLLVPGGEKLWQSRDCLSMATNHYWLINHPNRPYAAGYPCLGYQPVLCQERNIKKIEVFNVIYETKKARVVTRPASSKVTVITNNSNGPQEATRVITFSYETSRDWGNSVGGSVNVEKIVKAGIPAVAESEVKVGIEANYAHTWGKGETETKTDQIRAKATVPAKSQMSVWVSYKKNKIDIPYTASIKVYYVDGTYIIRKHSDVFKGVDAAEFHIQFSEAESLE